MPSQHRHAFSRELSLNEAFAALGTCERYAENIGRYSHLLGTPPSTARGRRVWEAV